MKIMNIVGARPNLPKIAPLLREMRKHKKIQPILIHTGQHFDDSMSGVFFRDMGIPEPDSNLECAGDSWKLIERLHLSMRLYQPDMVLVVGDVKSTADAALAAAHLNIPVAHVEAGLRSFDRTMPEEINRIVTDAVSTHFFCTEASAVEHLRMEGHSHDNIHMVGNVMIDSLEHFKPKTDTCTIRERIGLEYQSYAVLTLHRQSNVEDPKTLTGILRAANRIALELPVVFPVHPRTKQKIKELGLCDLNKNLKFVEPMGYVDFLCLQRHARFVMTDSGGIQEETTALHVPCLTLRDNTERPATLLQGSNVLVGTEPNRIVSSALGIIRIPPKFTRVPPLWDGHAAERIVNVLLKQVLCS